MKYLKWKLIPVAAALALMSAAGSANAAAYGYSYDNIFGLTITPTGPITFGSATVISRSTATLNGVSDIQGGSGVLDSPQAAVGAVVIGPNNFSQQGQAGDYSRGDAQIVSTQLPPSFPGATTQAVNVAESNLDTFGTADASGRNGSTTGFSVNFVVGAPDASLAFAFQADPFMQVFLDTLAGPGSSATANLVVTFTVTDATGAIVFNWAPDGGAGGITGGTETDDDANLNINLSTNTLTAGSLFTYDPTGCGAPVAPGTSTACGGNFGAFTNALAVGNYTLTLNAVESVDLVITQQVPEPGTLALLGLGLAGLCFGSRRRSSGA